METSRHFLLHCPVFAILMMKHIDNLTFSEPEDIFETDISRLNKFFISSKRLSICMGLVIQFLEVLGTTTNQRSRLSK